MRQCRADAIGASVVLAGSLARPRTLSYKARDTGKIEKVTVEVKGIGGH